MPLRFASLVLLSVALVLVAGRTHRAPDAPPPGGGVADSPGGAFHARPDGRGLSADIGTSGRADLDETGVTWTVSGESLRARLTTRAYGCAGALAPVEPLSPPRLGEGSSRAQTQERAGAARLAEWFVRDQRGLEQGWTLAERPCDGPVVRLEVAVAGLRPAARADGQGIDLRDPDGANRLRYSELSARGADGKPLAAAMSAVGGAIVIDVDTRGAEFPVVVDPLVWASPQLLQPKNASTIGKAAFGTAVAVSGTVAVVSAPAANLSVGLQGDVHVFGLANGTWTERQEFTAPEAVAVGAEFGFGIAMSGNTLVVNANEFNAGPGAAWLYTLSNGVWGSPVPLIAPDGQGGDRFGAALAISGSTVVVGAPNHGTMFQADGAVYIFDASGQFQQELFASNPAQLTEFGVSVAISGNTIVAGAVGGSAVYVFTLSGGTWSQLGPPLLATPSAGIGSVAVIGNTVFACQPFTNIGANFAQGAVDAFTQSGSGFGAPVRLVASDGSANAEFGYTLATSGDSLLVGSKTSHVYLFEQMGGSWMQQDEISTPDGSALTVPAFDGTTLLVGSGGGGTAGEAFIGPYGLSNGSACGGASLVCLSTFCVDGVCCDSSCTDACATCATGTCAPVAPRSTPTSSCNGYLCNGSSMACPTSCAADADCAAGLCCGSDSACHAQADAAADSTVRDATTDARGPGLDAPANGGDAQSDDASSGTSVRTESSCSCRLAGGGGATVPDAAPGAAVLVVAAVVARRLRRTSGLIASRSGGTRRAGIG